MTRFMRKGTSEYWFVPTISDIDAPTVAEVTAGTRLTPEIAELNGLSFQNNPIPTPDMASTFAAQIAGEDSADDTNIMFYEDDTTNPILTALAKGTVGYIVVMYAGVTGSNGEPAASDKCETWPCSVSSNARQHTAGNESAKYTVFFSMTSEPDQDATVAA